MTTNVDNVSSDSSPGQRFISWGGIGFVYLSALAFVALGFRLFLPVFREERLSSYLPEIILFAVAAFTALLGVSLLRATGLASLAPGPVINPEEWTDLKQKVTEGNEEAVTQYVRLRSLTGFTGLFTKLGIQGLPLATIALTVFFSLMFLDHTEFLDLAKLTLGAFIGSFVQKQVGERQASSGTVQLPSGERLKVQGAAPSPIA
jgi:hypothetical protein